MPDQRTEGHFKSMDAARPSQSSSIERDETEYDSKLRNVESVDNITAPETSATKGESSSQPSTSAQVLPEKADAPGLVDDEMRLILRRKIQESEVGKLKIPEFHSSGCCDCEETESDDDDDLCSTSSDDSEESYNPFASGVIPPVLPDIQLRVPMEDEVDVQRVRNALMIKGVLDVVCDEERQIVTVTGIVPASRILKKVRKVNRQARIISTASPFSGFINPNFRSSTFAAFDEEDSHGNNGIDIPTPRSTPNFVVHQHRLRPTFQRYNFHNSPHSPYLRTFSPSDLSPANSPPTNVTGDAYDHHRRFDSSFFDDELFLDTEFILN